MIVAAFGPPTIFCNVGFSFVRAMMEVMLPDCQHISANTSEELRKAWAEFRGTSVLFTSIAPDEKVTEIFLQSHAPILVFCCPGYEIAADHMRFGTDFKSAVRYSTKYLAMLDSFRCKSKVTVFERPDGHTDLAAVMLSIGKAIGFDPSPQQIDAAIAQFAPGHGPGMQKLVGNVLEMATDLEAQTREKEPQFNGLISTLDGICGCREKGGAPWSSPLNWPIDFFGGTQGALTSQDPPISLMGPARIFIDGPFMHVPAGDWIAHVEFEVSANQSDNAFQIEVICEEVRTGGPFKLPVEGRFSCDIPFTSPRPTSPVVFWMRLMEGAIDGYWRPISVTVSRAPA